MRADLTEYKETLTQKGFTIVENIYTIDELNAIEKLINAADTSKDTFRKSENLFAIRQFLKEVPEISNVVFNGNLKKLIREVVGENYFVVKSIYFDKPQSSNWYVSYHQDLTISVDKKIPIDGYGPWTVKQNQFAVQPTIEILENITTIRIHIDDTNENNGALRVVPKSHTKSIYRPETINWEKETEAICSVPKGGAMLMKPLLLHSSSRTTNNKARRVIHIELSDKELPDGLKWSERMSINW